MNKSFGQIIACDNLSIGGYVETGWYNDSYDIVDMLFSVICDQQIDIIMIRRDEELIEDSGMNLMTMPISTTYNTQQIGMRPGYSFKIRFMNNSGVVMTNLKARLQTMDK